MAATRSDLGNAWGCSPTASLPSARTDGYKPAYDRPGSSTVPVSEDLDTRTPRRFDKALINQLATGQWIREGLVLLIVGPTGVGKTRIACALAQHRQGYTTRYLRTLRLFEELCSSPTPTDASPS